MKKNNIPKAIKANTAKKIYAGKIKQLIKNKNFRIVQCGLYNDNDIVVNDLPEAPEEIKLVW